MSVAAVKISLEEFQSNPDIHYYDFNELHNGEVVIVTLRTKIMRIRSPLCAFGNDITVGHAPTYTPE